MEQKLKLGYWSTRGMAQVPRLLMALTNTPWEDVRYTAPTEWFGADKEKLGFDFPNLPYLIDGDIKLTETKAICTYIIMRSDQKHHPLVGNGVVDVAKVAMLGGVLGEVLGTMIGLLFSDQFEKRDEIFKEKLAPKLDLIAKFVGDKDWAMGYLTVVDFWITEGSYYVEKVFEAEYKKYGFMQRIREKFEALP